MKLKKVSARNLKGLTFTLDLASISFLVGSNFAGKTARTDAIRLLLIGFLPELGKLASATFGLCSGRELVVEGEFDDGSKLSRRWFAKGDSIKSEVTLPAWFDEKKGDLLTVMLNAETYFALSERGRVDYVFANIPDLGAEAQPPAILATVEQSLREDEELDKDAAARFFSALEAAQRSAETEERFENWTPQSFLDFALEFTTEEGKKSKTAAVTLEKTAQGLAYLRAAETVEADLPSLDAAREKLDREREPLMTEKARVLAAAERAKADRRRREQLEGELRARNAFETQKKTHAATLERLKAELEEVPKILDLETLRADERDATNAQNDHSRQLREVEEAIARNEREKADVDAKTTCPYCGAVGDGWKALKAGQIDSALAGLRTKKDQLSAHLVTLRNHATTLLTRLNNARTAAASREVKEREIRTAQTSLDSVEKNLAILDGKAEELSRIPADDPNAVKALEDAQRAIEAKNAELYAVEQKRKAAMGRAHDLKRLAEAEKGRDDARLDEAVAKKAAVRLREQQAAIVEAAFGPLLTTANSFFSEVLKSPLAYHDGEIGTWRSGVWVGHRTFSGTEKALAYAAIQAALSSRCPVRIMLVDELGRLDLANAEKVVGTIAKAIKAGSIDQFVGIDTGRAATYQAEGSFSDADLTVLAIQ